MPVACLIKITSLIPAGRVRSFSFHEAHPSEGPQCLLHGQTQGKPRAGFFEHDEDMKRREVLPGSPGGVLTMRYYTGMREGKRLSLTRVKVYLIEGKITLEAGDTKNGKAALST